MNESIKKFLVFPLTKIILGIGICFGLLVATRHLVIKPVFYALISQRNIADTVINYMCVMLLLLSYAFLFRFYERRAVSELSVKTIGKEAPGGFLLGFVAISVAIGVLYVLGQYTIIGVSSASYMLAPFSLLVLAAMIEDLFIRGLILRTLENWIGTYWSLLIVMVIEAQHVFNPNSNWVSFIFDLVWGFSLASLYLYTKRIWLPFFFHLGWNFSQPFYGSKLSGLDMGHILQANFEGSDLLTGGTYGIEASVFSGFVLLVIGLTFFGLSIKRGKIVKAQFKYRSKPQEDKPF